MNFNNTLYAYVCSSANKIFANWPNAQTERSCIGLTINMICLSMLKNIEHQPTIAIFLNLPVRLLNILDGAREKNMLKIACQVSALAALLCPYGLVASIGVDCISEGLNLYRSCPDEGINSQALVLYVKEKKKKSHKGFSFILNKIISYQPNIKSERFCIAFITNLVCQLMISKLSTSSSPAALILNAPLRILNIKNEVQDKNLVRAAGQIAAFAALFFPYGLIVSMGIDCILEGENLYKSYPPSQASALPPFVFHIEFKTRERALEFLGFPATANLNDVDKIVPRFDNMSKYDYSIKFLKERQARSTPYFASNFQIWLDNFENAYQFLIDEEL